MFGERENMSEMADRILASINDKDYVRAYLIGLEALDESKVGYEEIVAALRELTARIRSECMDRAISKNDYDKEYIDLEALLRKVNLLTGQDMYGRIRE